MRPLIRAPLRLPASAYKTYAISSPISTHYRPGTCTEVDCQAQARGWSTTVDETTDLGMKQAHYIRKLSGRKFAERREPAGLTVFAFEPGQKCFATHQVSLQRPETFYVRGGDYRGNPLGTPAYRHTRAELWVEDFGEHQQKLADELKRG